MGSVGLKDGQGGASFDGAEACIYYCIVSGCRFLEDNLELRARLPRLSCHITKVSVGILSIGHGKIVGIEGDQFETWIAIDASHGEFCLVVVILHDVEWEWCW